MDLVLAIEITVFSPCAFPPLLTEHKRSTPITAIREVRAPRKASALRVKNSSENACARHLRWWLFALLVATASCSDPVSGQKGLLSTDIGKPLATTPDLSDIRENATKPL